jgi:hypothetical protein
MPEGPPMPGGPPIPGGPPPILGGPPPILGGPPPIGGAPVQCEKIQRVGVVDDPPPSKEGGGATSAFGMMGGGARAANSDGSGFSPFFFQFILFSQFPKIPKKRQKIYSQKRNKVYQISKIEIILISHETVQNGVVSESTKQIVSSFFLLRLCRNCLCTCGFAA